MSAVRKRAGRIFATLLGCGIVVLGSTELVRAGSKHCSTARKNGRTVLCSGSIGFHPTCWRTWPEGEPTCPPIGSPLQPTEASVEGARRGQDSYKVRIEGDATSRESVPTSQKAANPETNPVSVP